MLGVACLLIVMLNAFLLSFIMLSVITLSVTRGATFSPEFIIVGEAEA
jgi:hypothetical protein